MELEIIRETELTYLTKIPGNTLYSRLPQNLADALIEVLDLRLEIGQRTILEIQEK